MEGAETGRTVLSDIPDEQTDAAPKFSKNFMSKNFSRPQKNSKSSSNNGQ